jgi:hypothetical protein
MMQNQGGNGSRTNCRIVTINTSRIGNIIKAYLVKRGMCQHFKGNRGKLVDNYIGGILISVVHRILPGNI